MWKTVAELILRGRIVLLILIGLLTLTLGWIGLTRVHVSHEFLNVVPKTDPDKQQYERFRSLFGEDGATILVAIECPSGTCFTASTLRGLDSLTTKTEKLLGVARVDNLSRAYGLRANDSLERFETFPLIDSPPRSPEDAREIEKRVNDLPFYEQLLAADSGRILLSAVVIDKEYLDSPQKNVISREVQTHFDAWAKAQNLKMHYAGLPYLRAFNSTHLPKEVGLFSILSIILTAAALLFFYRSLWAVVFPVLLLIISSLCTLGIIGLLGYELSALTALLPPIIIILGIPPSIYMLSDYHEEYRKSGDKKAAMKTTIERLGLVTFMINANTGFGFLTLYLTEVRTLQEFGLVAFLGTMLAYVLSIILIPGIFSLLPPPSEKELKHLDAPFIKAVLKRIERAIKFQRKTIYIVTAVLFAVSLVGVTQLKFVSYLTDDLPKGEDIHADLHFMQHHFKGIMPFEVVIDTKKKDGVRSRSNLKRIDRLQKRLAEYPELSRTVAITDVMKWSRQALYGGIPAAYDLPAREEMDFIGRYARDVQNPTGNNLSGSKRSPVANLVDSTWQTARISGYVRDLGSDEMPKLLVRVQADIDSIFKGEDGPEVFVTGATRIFLKTNDYLIDNLAWSLLATFLIIGLQMLLLFNSWRIMAISMIPNLIPLVVVAGMMGFIGMFIKPSTALVYELAFGIAIDNSIHYLASYRYFRRRNQSKEEAVQSALRFTGVGIVYTSVVLFFGFGIFTLSDFGSTQALGILTSVTLLIAMFSNLLFMPALLLNCDSDAYRSAALIDSEEKELEE